MLLIECAATALAVARAVAASFAANRSRAVGGGLDLRFSGAPAEALGALHTAAPEEVAAVEVPLAVKSRRARLRSSSIVRAGASVVARNAVLTPEASPTPCPSNSPAAPTVYWYEIGPDQANRVNACNNFGGDPRTDVYTSEGNPGYVLQFFTDFNLTYEFVGSGDIYCYARHDDLTNKYTTNINSFGQSVSSRDAC